MENAMLPIQLNIILKIYVKRDEGQSYVEEKRLCQYPECSRGVLHLTSAGKPENQLDKLKRENGFNLHSSSYIL